MSENGVFLINPATLAVPGNVFLGRYGHCARHRLRSQFDHGYIQSFPGRGSSPVAQRT